MTPTPAPQIPGLDYVEPLGAGGYADVLLYQQQSPRMPVAVKVLKGEGLTESVRSQFVNEADTMAQLGDHPYIVQVFRADTASDGRPYLVMKYYPPPNLAARSRVERLPVPEVLRTGIQLGSAVETAHRANIIHRDIKPANVLVSPYGVPGLTDFGIAGRGGPEQDTGDTGVSVPWAPPEVLYGHNNGDVRGDVYSLAATLWQLLVGRSPFEVPGGDNSAYALMPRIRSTPVPTTGRADVPASLERLLARAMAKDPAARPASAIELARALQEVEVELHLPATPIVVLDEQGQTTTESAGPPVLSPRSSMSPVPAVATAYGTYAAPQGPPAPPAPPPDGHTQPRALVGAGARDPRDPGVRAPGSSFVPSPPGDHSGSGGFVRPARPLDDQPPVPPPPPGGRAGRSGRAARSGRPARSARARATPQENPRWLLPVVAGVVVLGLVAAIVVLWPRSTAPAVSTPLPASTGSPTVASTGPGDVLAPPALTATTGTGKVLFAWSYADPRSTDVSRVYVGPTVEATTTARPSSQAARTLTVSAAAGKTVCAVVQVVRANLTSPVSATKCETAQ